jgi:hypothetical protein
MTCLIALAAGLAALAGEASRIEARDRIESHIENRILTELPAEAWRHELAWILSSDDVLFGRIAAVRLLSDGVVAVADMQLGQILLVAPEGAVLQARRVTGEGPGLVTRLAGLCEGPRNRLHLIQAWPGRVEVTARDGIPVRSLVLGGRGEQTGLSTLLSLDWSAGLLAGVQVDVRILDHRRSQNTFRLSCFDDDLATMSDVLLRSNVTVDRMGVVDETEMDFPVHAWGIVDERNLVVAPDRSQYRLEVHDRDLGLCEVFRRDLKPLPRPRSEMEQLRSEFSLQVDGQSRAIEFVFFETAQMIQKIVVIGRGRLLLTTAYLFHEIAHPATARLDLVDLSAGTVREIRIAVPVDSRCDRLLMLPNRDALVLVGGAAVHAEHVVPAIAYWRFVGEGS